MHAMDQHSFSRSEKKNTSNEDQVTSSYTFILFFSDFYNIPSYYCCFRQVACVNTIVTILYCCAGNIYCSMLLFCGSALECPVVPSLVAAFIPPLSHPVGEERDTIVGKVLPAFRRFIRVIFVFIVH